MNFNYLKGLEHFEGDPVVFIKDSIEAAIEIFYREKANGRIHPSITFPEFYTGNFLKKRYSTNAELTDTNSGDLYGECYEDSGILLQIVAIHSGLNLEIVKSNFTSPYKSNPFKHFYLRTFIGSQEVIVETTLGQFLTNHRGIFVGTRRDLKDLFVNALRDDPQIFSQRWSWYRELLMETPERMFEVIWGDNSADP